MRDQEFYDERARAMLSLRINNFMTLREIGDEFGITRERVRQILSRFDYPKKFGKVRKEQLGLYKSLTNQQVADELGISYTTVSKYRGNTRHAVDGKHGEVYEWQESVANKLRYLGVECELLPYKKKYSILTSGELHIAVSTCNKYLDSPSLNYVNEAWKFGVRGSKKVSVVDYYVLIVVPHNAYFIVPSVEVGQMKHIVFTWPNVYHTSKQRWQQYHNRWDLIVNENNYWLDKMERSVFNAQVSASQI